MDAPEVSLFPSSHCLSSTHLTSYLIPSLTMGVFSKGFFYLLRDFSSWTTTHGVPHIGMSSHIVLRAFWVDYFTISIMIFILIVVIGCLIGFFIQIHTLISRYLSYEVNTQTNMEFMSRKFPVVTIWHLNPWKKGALANASPYFNEMMAAYSISSVNPSFGFSAARNGARQARSIQLTTMAADYLFGVSNDSIVNGTTNYEDPAYSYNDLVASCTYNAGECNSTYFSFVNDPNYGRCIQNYNPIELSSRAGPLYGLTMTIRTEQIILTRVSPRDKVGDCFVGVTNGSDYEEINNNLNCINEVLSGSNRGFNVLTYCNCPQPCETQMYEATISSGKWPSFFYVPNECTAKDQTGKRWMNGKTGSNQSACLPWNQKKTLSVQIFYERLDYQQFSEFPAYSVVFQTVSLVSDMGGQVGLFLGMSIISVFEILTLFLLIFYYVSSHRARKLELQAIEDYVKKAEVERVRNWDEREEEFEMENTELERKEARRKAKKMRKEAEL